jgi:hypothetical protein
LISLKTFQTVAASIEELYGTFLYLCTDFEGAKEAYQNSLAIQPTDSTVPRKSGNKKKNSAKRQKGNESESRFEVHLKLAAISVEIGTFEEVRFCLLCC